MSEKCEPWAKRERERQSYGNSKAAVEAMWNSMENTDPTIPCKTQPGDPGDNNGPDEEGQAKKRRGRKKRNLSERLEASKFHKSSNQSLHGFLGIQQKTDTNTTGKDKRNEKETEVLTRASDDDGLQQLERFTTKGFSQSTSALDETPKDRMDSIPDQKVTQKDERKNPKMNSFREFFGLKEKTQSADDLLEIEKADLDASKTETTVLQAKRRNKRQKIVGNSTNDPPVQNDEQAENDRAKVNDHQRPNNKSESFKQFLGMFDPQQNSKPPDSSAETDLVAENAQVSDPKPVHPFFMKTKAEAVPEKSEDQPTPESHEKASLPSSKGLDSPKPLHPFFMKRTGKYF